MSKKKSKVLKRLKKGPILCAEGYLFELERRGYLKAGAFVPEVVLEHPEVVKQLHREFLRAGSDVMVAFTYYAHRAKMKKIGRENDLELINRTAIRLAKEVAKEGNALVAGNICNTWEYENRSDIDAALIARPMFEEQVQWAKEEGVDFIIGETFSYLTEALLALDVIKKSKLTALISLIPTREKTFDDQYFDDACHILEKEGADIVGLNCGKGPSCMLPILREIKKTVKIPLAALPVPYRTNMRYPNFQGLEDRGKKSFPVNLDPFTCTRVEMADFASKAKEIGVEYIGICCGAGPHHVRSMAEAIGKKPLASRYSPDLSQHPILGKEQK